MHCANVAFVGTGFVADYYMITLANHPNIKLKGVWDMDQSRLIQFCEFYNTKTYAYLEELLGDADIDIVINLTTPESHFDINLAALSSGRHIYCGKPLAMKLDDAMELARVASQNNLTFCSAPANALSDAFRVT